jgi:peroxiredoxin
VFRKDLLTILVGLALGGILGLIIYIGIKSYYPSSNSDVFPAGRQIPGFIGAGSPAPQFELQSLSGEHIKLSDFHGRTVLINFWATWCGPCRLEMPAIQSRYERYGDELVVLAVNFDEEAPLVQQFTDELGLTFPVLLDPGGEVQRLYRVRGYPTTVFVDADGLIEIQHIGLMTEKQLDGYLAQAGVIQ